MIAECFSDREERIESGEIPSLLKTAIRAGGI